MEGGGGGRQKKVLMCIYLFPARRPGKIKYLSFFCSPPRDLIALEETLLYFNVRGKGGRHVGGGSKNQHTVIITPPPPAYARRIVIRVVWIGFPLLFLLFASFFFARHLIYSAASVWEMESREGFFPPSKVMFLFQNGFWGKEGL